MPIFEAFWQGRLIPGARIDTLPFMEAVRQKRTAQTKVGPSQLSTPPGSCCSSLLSGKPGIASAAASYIKLIPLPSYSTPTRCPVQDILPDEAFRRLRGALFFGPAFRVTRNKLLFRDNLQELLATAVPGRVGGPQGAAAPAHTRS